MKKKGAHVALGLILGTFALSPDVALSQDQEFAESHREASGLGLEIGVGAASALRRMTLTGTERTIRHEPGPYFGGSGDLILQLFTLDEHDIHGSLQVHAGYGTSRNSDTRSVDVVGRSLVTEFAWIEALLVLDRQITSTLDVRFGAGFGATSLTIERNPLYTGHRYMGAVATAGFVRWWENEDFRIIGELSAIPSFFTNQSDGGYGHADAFGGRARLTGGWRFLQPRYGDRTGSAELLLSYDYTRWQTNYPEGTILGDLGRSTDDQHRIQLRVRYGL